MLLSLIKKLADWPPNYQKNSANISSNLPGTLIQCDFSGLFSGKQFLRTPECILDFLYFDVILSVNQSESFLLMKSSGIFILFPVN